MEAPFALLYGFRGSTYDVDLLSPYEMLLHWSFERICAPTAKDSTARAVWTAEGLQYQSECKICKKRPQYLPGVHYVAVEGPDRILMPHSPALGNLRQFNILLTSVLKCWYFRTQSPPFRYNHNEGALPSCAPPLPPHPLWLRINFFWFFYMFCSIYMWMYFCFWRREGLIYIYIYIYIYGYI